MGTALISATPVLAQARWGSADQPIARSYGWSGYYNGPYDMGTYYSAPRAYGAAPYSSYNYYDGGAYGTYRAPRYNWRSGDSYYPRDEFARGMRFGNSDLW